MDALALLPRGEFSPALIFEGDDLFDDGGLGETGEIIDQLEVGILELVPVSLDIHHDIPQLLKDGTVKVKRITNLIGIVHQ